MREKKRKGNKNSKVSEFGQSGSREGVKTRSARMNEVTEEIIKNKEDFIEEDISHNIDHRDSDESDEGTWYRKPKIQNESKKNCNKGRDVIAPPLSLEELMSRTLSRFSNTISTVAGYHNTADTNTVLKTEVNSVDKMDEVKKDKKGNCPMCDVEMKIETLE